MIFQRSAARNAGGEIEGVRVTAAAAVAKHNRPEARNREGLTCGIFEPTQPGPADGIERVDAAIPEIANQQCAAKRAQTFRGQRQAPRRIEHAVGSKASQEITAGVEHIYETVAGTGGVVLLIRILFGVGDKKLAANSLDVERRKASWYGRVSERTGQGGGSEVGVEDIDLS